MNTVKTHPKRIISFVMALAMVFSLTPMSAFAVTEVDGPLTPAVTNATVTKSSETQTVNLVHYILEDAEIASIGMDVKIEDPNNVGATFLGGVTHFVDSITGGINIVAGNTEGAVGSFDRDAGHHATYDDAIGGYALTTIPISIPADAVGTFTVVLSNFVHADFENASGYEFAKDSVTATITVEEPSAPAADYEIYYTLNSTADADRDSYADYDIKKNKQVTAMLYIKSNNADVTLQAYDIYLTYGPNLSYNSETMAGIAYVDGAKVEAAAQTGDAVTHIQLAADNSKTYNLEKGKAVELGTIVFDINEAAQYGQELEITLTPGSEEQGEDCTNIAVADGINNATGNEKSYYPSTTQDIKGAEVTTTYTVTYNANTSNDVTGMPEPQTKEYNKALTLSDATPTRSGYTFKGWSTDEGENNTVNAGATYTGNADETFYAVWQKNTVTVTWMNGNSQLKQEDVDYNTVPSYTDETPTKDATAEHTYTFAGWTTDPNGTTAETLTAVTANTTYYAVFTSETNKYDITWLNQDGTELEKDVDIVYGTALSSIAPVAPTKDADNTYTYTFAGWASSANQESGTATANLGDVTGDATYYAAFSKEYIDYTVTFSDDTTTTTKTKHYGETVTLPSASKTGYTFDGWYSGETKIGDAGTNYTVAGNVTLTAKYTAVTYTITYEENGGTTVDNGTYTVEDTVTLPTIEKEGATFGGWFENSNFSGTAVTEIAKGTIGDKTYYAKWTNNNYTITNATIENGTVSAVNSKDNTTSANKGDIINVTVTPKVGYEIDTVTYTLANGKAETITAVEGTYSFTMPAANVTVSATFTAIDYTVEVGTVTNGTVTIQDGASTTDKLETAHVGGSITLNVTPNAGYQIKTVSYTVDGGSATILTANEGEYSFEMPAGNVTVTAEFEAISYTITYNTNGGSAIENGNYTVEGTVTLPTTSTKTGYTFAGWCEDKELTGTAVTTIAAGTTGDKTYYAKWTPNTNTPYTVNHWQQNINGGTEQNETNYTLKDTEELTGTTAAEVAPDVKSYEGFTAPSAQTVTIAADGTTVVNYYYTRNSYNISLDEDGGSYAEGVTEPTSYTYGVGATLPTPAKDGYTFDGWFDGETKVDSITATDTGEKELTAQWTAIEYTITFELDGGAWPTDVTITDNQMTYTIESAYTLPTAEKEYYTFGGWKVTTAGGNWASDAVSNAGTAVTDKYGDVTLTAQWNRAATPVVEEYKYAADDYWMIRVDASNVTENQEYKFNGVSMYYTTDSNYLVDSDDTGVFYTLIPATYVDATNKALTDDGYDLLTIDVCTNRTTITYDGDINGDNVVNIADANVVYQMTVNGGAYYNNLTTAQRLAADMVKSTANAEHRASIEDVNAIINIINNATSN